MNRFKKLIFTVGTTVVLAASLGGCKLFPDEEAVVAPTLITPPKITYTTVKAKRGDIVKSIDVDGRFVSPKQYDYAFTSRSGYIKTLNFKAGDFVKKGDVLAELDSDYTQNQVQQAEITVKKAELTYKKLKNNPSVSDYDRQIAALDLQSAQLDLQTMKEELAKTRLVATSSGVIVYAAKVNIGQLVETRTPIYSVADPNDLQLEYEGSTASQFKLGMKVNIDYNGITYTGQVVTAPENIPDSSDATQTQSKDFIRVKIDKIPENANFSDTVKISVELERKNNVIVLDKTLVREYEEASYVQILENGTKVERFVETGIESGNTVEITKGVNEGDLIIQD